jgi:hypothetical protein
MYDIKIVIASFLPYMPTFPIYAGFSRFEAVEKMNPDILIGIAKLPRNPDFLNISPLSRRLTPNLNSAPLFFMPANQKSGQAVRHYLCTCEACREQV